LEAALQRYGSSTFKAPVATVLDPNGKLSITLTYGKYFVFVLIDILNTFIHIIIYIIIVFISQVNFLADLTKWPTLS